MGVSKVIYGNTTLIDLSGDTVAADKLYKGRTALGPDGNNIVGTIPVGVVMSQTEYDNLSAAEKNDNTYHFVSNNNTPSGDGVGDAAKSKVVYGNTTVIDVSEKNVSKKSLLAGYTAHGKNGGQFTGTGKNVVYITQADYDALPSATKTNGDYYYITQSKLWARIYKNSSNKYVLYFEADGISEHEGEQGDSFVSGQEYRSDGLTGFFGSNKPGTTSGTKENCPWRVGNEDVYKNIVKVVFTDKFCKYSRPYGMRNLLCTFINLTEVINLHKLNVSNVRSTAGLFQGCAIIETIDITGWDLHSVTDAIITFGDNPRLVTIYANEKVKFPTTCNSENMFRGCTSLVGGNGTTFNSSITNRTYARIDKPGTPGYFTEKTEE